MKSALVMNSKATVSSKGQVVIPRILREKTGIHPGSELFFTVRADGIIEIKRVERSIEMFFGRCKQTDKKHEKAMSIKEIDSAIMQAVKENDNKTIDE